MRCPKSLGNGLNSSPGSSRWSLTHLTIRAICTSCRSVYHRDRPVARRAAAAGERAGAGMVTSARAAASGSPAPAPGQRPCVAGAGPRHGGGLESRSPARARGGIRHLPGLRSPHRWVAAVLLLVAVGIADLVSVRVV